MIRTVLIDRVELDVVRHLARWEPECDAAVLIGYPFSPLAHAAPRLARRGIPYVVDIGDPWALTGGSLSGGPVRTRRATRAERAVWTAARGAIVTTRGQADGLQAMFPHLKILVRPNGFDPVPSVSRPTLGSSRRDDAELRLVHYGNLYGPRVDIEGFFASLARSGRWRRVVLRQHGDDWERVLDRVAKHVTVEVRPKISWSDVVSQADQFDAALVVGNRNPVQLPSKAVQYLTLPIPRVALVGDPADALARYVADKSGWLTLTAGDSARLAAFCTGRWSAKDLEPPPQESWAAVEAAIGSFVVETVRSSQAAPVRRTRMEGVVG